jgi:CheY-like chemotaxis protein
MNVKQGPTALPSPDENAPDPIEAGARGREPAEITQEILLPSAPIVHEARLSILIIDGYRVLADTLHELLTGNGWRVARAYDGMEGLSLADLFRPDVIFCDLQLRRRPDAYDVARTIRAKTPGVVIHLVGLTTADHGTAHNTHLVRASTRSCENPSISNSSRRSW